MQQLATHSAPVSHRATSLWRYLSGDPVSVITLFFALIGAAIMMIPFVWALLSSFKPLVEYTFVPPTWLPRNWTIDGYVFALTQGGLLLALKNSLIVSTLGTFLMVLGAALAGYAFARLRFPCRPAVFMLVLATMMIPWPVVLLPAFILIVRFPLAGGNDVFGMGGTGFVNTYAGLILPHLSYPFGIYLMREFFNTLPSELEDAARVDGAGELRVLFQIMVPLCKPALAALSIFAFQGNWNAFIWPLVVTNEPGMNTIQLAVQLLQYLTDYDVQGLIRWDVVNAGGLISVIPVAITFLVGQRYFVRGIAMTGFR